MDKSKNPMQLQIGCTRSERVSSSSIKELVSIHGMSREQRRVRETGAIKRYYATRRES